MKNLLSLILLLAWALWFGGLITLFIAVMTLFADDRAVAVQAAPRIFVAFGTYQLILAAVTLIAIVVWYAFVRARVGLWLFILCGIAAVGAGVVSGLLIPRMEAMRAAGQSASPEYRQMHQRSERVFVAETLALLAEGCVLPGVLRRDSRNTAQAPPVSSASAST